MYPAPGNGYVIVANITIVASAIRGRKTGTDECATRTKRVYFPKSVSVTHRAGKLLHSFFRKESPSGARLSGIKATATPRAVSTPAWLTQKLCWSRAEVRGGPSRSATQMICVKTSGEPLMLLTP